jgi:hypothetical protein
VPIFGEKKAFFSKNSVVINFLQKLAVAKTGDIFTIFSAKIFSESYYRSTD